MNAPKGYSMTFFRRARRDEGGASFILAAVGMVLAMIAAGLAIDIGRLARDAREDQKVADLAALDAIRVLPGVIDQSLPGSVTQAARDSATRNGFTYSAPGYSLGVQWAATKAGPFSSSTADLAAATVVRVTATSPHTNEFPFLAGRTSMSRSAVAEKKTIAGFTLGSSLVTVNSTSSTLLNGVLSQWMGGAVNLSLVSWQGIAAGEVTLAALQTQLLASGFSVGSVNELLNADLTLAQFYTATANALTLNGDTVNANLFNALAVSAVSATTFKLGRMITVEQGSETAAGSAHLNLLQLVTGSATVANGSNLIDISNLGVSVPGVTSTKLSLRVIEGPKTYIGRPGTGPHVTTGQISLTLTPVLNLDVLSLLRVTGDFPVELHSAGATGTLKSVSCPSKNIVVTADPIAFSGNAQTSTLSVKAIAGLIPVLDLGVTSVTPGLNGPAQDLSFTYSADFSPPNQTSKHAGSDPVGLNSLTNLNGNPANVSLLGLLTVGLGESAVVTGVLNALRTVLTNLDNNVLTPLLKTLGMDIGGADVTALGADAFGLGLPSCGLPGLAA
jgi:uncharacterized membrane protein